MSRPLILASTSSIRLQLLRNAGLDVTAQAARVDEETIRQSLEAEGATPRDIADALAEMKAAIKQALPYFYASDRGTFAEEHHRAPIDFFCSSVALDVTITVFPANGLSDHGIVVAAIGGITSGA